MIERRDFLKAGGAAGVAGIIGGVGLTTLSETGRAQISADFATADPGTVTNDDGDVTNVYLDPTSNVQWENFDVPVTKVRQLLEARLADGSGTTLTPESGPTPATQNGWWPIYRETPWLFRDPADGETADFTYDPDGDGSGTDKVLVTRGDGSPSYADEAEAGTSGNIEYPLLPNGAPDRDADQGAILVAADDYPKPAYVDEAENPSGYLSGVTIGDANTNVQYANANGKYGTVGDTSTFDNPTDDSVASTEVHLRLTTTLHTDYDFVEHDPDGYTKDRYDPLAMANAPDAGHQFGTTTGITYADQQAAAKNHPAVSVQRSSFTVNAANELADSSSDTTGGSGAN